MIKICWRQTESPKNLTLTSLQLTSGDWFDFIFDLIRLQLAQRDLRKPDTSFLLIDLFFSNVITRMYTRKNRSRITWRERTRTPTNMCACALLNYFLFYVWIFIFFADLHLSRVSVRTADYLIWRRNAANIRSLLNDRSSSLRLSIFLSPRARLQTYRYYFCEMDF